MAKSLNTEQEAAYTAILQSVLNNEGKAFLIDGPDGTGISYLYKTLSTKLQSLGFTICACASTGIAATLIDGCIVHKLLGVPMDLHFDSNSILKTDSKAAQIISNSACIVWDEASSSHRSILDLADRFLKDICRDPRPFGGKNLILGGD